MSEYNPDKWVIVELKEDGKKGVQKVLGGWSGGYLDSDNWRISSGVTHIEEKGDYYIITNHSGSIYKCHKNTEGFNAISSGVYIRIKNQCEKAGHSVKVLWKDPENEV